MRVPQAACREPAGVQNMPPSVLYVFEHNRKYILIHHAPHPRIVAFLHISNITPRISLNGYCSGCSPVRGGIILKQDYLKGI